MQIAVKFFQKHLDKKKTHSFEPALLLEKVPDASERVQDFMVSLNQGSAWREVRFVYTKKLLAVSSPNYLEIIDVVPLHEITAIRAGEVDSSSIALSEDGGSRGLNIDESFVGGKQPKLFYIDTEAEGYNSGRTYKLRASQTANLNIAIIMGDLEKVSAAAKERALARSKFRKSQERVRKVLEHNFFQKTIAILIVLNFGLDISSAQQHSKFFNDDGSATDYRKMLDRLNLGFSLIFTAELAAVIYANWFRRFFEDYWNILDAVVIFASLATLGETNYSVLRMVRILRIIRVFGKFRTFRKLLMALTSCFIPILCTFLLLVVIVSLYSILGVAMFADNAPTAFGAFDKAFISMFLVLASGNWTPTVPLVNFDGSTDVKPSLFYISYVMVQSWVVLQFCTAVLVESFNRASFGIEMQAIHKAQEARRLVDPYHDPLDPLLSKLYKDYRDDNDLSDRLRKLFKVLDSDKKGSLTAQEIASSLKKLISLEFQHVKEYAGQNLSQRIHFTPPDFENLTQRGKLCNMEGALEVEGFEIAIRAELKRYSMAQLAGASAQSSQEAAAAQIGALKAALLHLHSLEREQLLMERKMSDLSERLEKEVVDRGTGRSGGGGGGSGTVAVDTIEDLFRHIARPICDRLDKVVAPLRAEVAELRAAVLTGQASGAGAPHESGPIYSPKVRSMVAEGNHREISVDSYSHRSPGAVLDTAEAGQRTGLKSWAEGFGLRPLVQLAGLLDNSLQPNDAAVDTGARPPPRRQGDAGEDVYKSRGQRVSLLQSKGRQEPKNDIVAVISHGTHIPLRPDSELPVEDDWAYAESSASVNSEHPAHHGVDGQLGASSRKTPSLRPTGRKADRMSAKLVICEPPANEEVTPLDDAVLEPRGVIGRRRLHRAGTERSRR